MKVLRKEMKLKRMTVTNLAEKVGVSKTTIMKWLNGKSHPGFDNMDKLEALGFSQTACLEPSKEVEA